MDRSPLGGECGRRSNWSCNVMSSKVTPNPSVCGRRSNGMIWTHNLYKNVGPLYTIKGAVVKGKWAMASYK